MPVDLSSVANPDQFRAAVGTIVHIARRAPLEVIERGVNWYGDVNDAARKAGKEHDFSTRQGTGIVAAASPQMDFENKNIHALSEIRNLGPEHWNMIQASANQPRVPNPTKDKPNQTKAASRIPEVTDMLKEVTPSLAQANDRGLMKAGRILQGEDPDLVLSRRTGPKTNAFFHNLNDPSGKTTEGRDRVTIDGRAYDIAANAMHPWKEGRGISSADNTTGVMTRYEHFESAYHGARKTLARTDPAWRDRATSALQAVTWEGGKHIEIHDERFALKSGKQRKQGPTRAYQPYAPKRPSLVDQE